MKTAVQWLLSAFFCFLFASHASAQEVQRGQAANVQAGPMAPTQDAPPEVQGQAATPQSSASPQAEAAASDAALAAELAAIKARIAELENEAALRNIETGTESAALELDEPKLSIYGFMDVGYDHWFLDGDADDDVGVMRPTEKGSFVFGNLNVYVDANISRQWQALFEIRYTLMPHGEETDLGPPVGTKYQRVDTTAFDQSSPSAQTQLRLGSIFLERAYTEWKPSDLFRLRAGVFLNPFGIWNVDHGSPTLIALSLPTFIAGQMMPGRLLGLQALGAKAWSNKRLEYSLHVSNGRTPLNFDLSEDKALGGRLSFGWDWSSSSLVLGASTYHGTYLDQHKVVNLVDASTPGAGYFDWQTVISYREHVWAGDLRWNIGNFRLCAEGVARWVYYDKGKREAVYSETRELLYAADRLEWDAYLIAAYRTPWRLEPYIMAEAASKAFTLPRFAGDGVNSADDRTISATSFGLNFRITPRILLKTQAQMLRTRNEDNKFIWDAYAFYSRIVTSF